jgi:hypothetical protein
MDAEPLTASPARSEDPAAELPPVPPSETWMMTTSSLSGLPMRVRVARYAPLTIEVKHGLYETAEQRTVMEALLAAEIPGKPTAYLAAWAAGPDFTDWRIAYQYTDAEPLPGNWDVNKVRLGSRLWEEYLPLLEEHAKKSGYLESRTAQAMAAETSAERVPGLGNSSPPAVPGGPDFPHPPADRYVVARINKTFRTLGRHPGPQDVGKTFVPYDNRHLSKEAAEESAKASNDRYRPHLHGKTHVAVQAEPVPGTNKFRNLEHPSLAGKAVAVADPQARRPASPSVTRTSATTARTRRVR